MQYAHYMKAGMAIWISWKRKH